MNGFCKGLREAKNRGVIPVIPDFKMISPRDGALFEDRDPILWARRMEAIGAPALSVVTEPKEFGGSLSLLREIVKAVNIPVLRKDFITREADLELTAEAGACAVLLICACITEARLTSLYRTALSLGLEPLVEAHTARELKLAGRLGAGLVGINNRDILALERDGGTVSTTSELAAWVPKGALLISESGISTPEEARAATEAGAGAVLVGTAIWRAADPAACFRALCRG